jgi:transcriptional regulator with XRE-family HTH domain
MSELAEKINRLFETFTKPDGSEYTYREVEDGTNRAVTAAYVWRLRTGKAENPGYRVLAALCRFFEVSITYFFSEEPEAEVYVKELRLARALHEEGVAHLARRAGELDEEGRNAVLEMIEYVRKAQGLSSKFNGEEQPRHNRQDAGDPG